MANFPFPINSFLSAKIQQIISFWRKGHEKKAPLRLPFVNNVDARCGQGSCHDIFPIERFVEADARGDGSNHWDERVVDGYLAHRIAGEQLVVEREANGADGDEQCELDAANGCGSW